MLPSYAMDAKDVSVPVTLAEQPLVTAPYCTASEVTRMLIMRTCHALVADRMLLYFSTDRSQEQTATFWLQASAFEFLLEQSPFASALTLRPALPAKNAASEQHVPSSY